MLAAIHREGKHSTHLLVEDTVALVDVGDVAFVFVVPLPRELALLVDAIVKIS